MHLTWGQFLIVSVLVMLWGLWIPASSHRILLVPALVPSYLHEYQILGQALLSRGHDVYIVVPESTPNLNRFTTHGIKILTFQGTGAEVNAKMQLRASQAGLADRKQQMALMLDASNMLLGDCHYMMGDKRFLSQVASLNFHFAVASSMLLAPCSAILPHNLSIPYATMGSFSGISWLTRAPILPSFVPTTGARNYGDKMNFFQRLHNLFFHWVNFPGVPAIFPGGSNTSLLQTYAPGMHTWVNLLERSELFIMPKDHHLSWPMPLLPNIITVAGITAGPAQPLTADIKHFVEGSKEGVIVVSFGTMYGQMPRDLALKFMKAFQQVKQLVIWKSNPTLESNFPDLPKNVKFMPWIPQNDLLGHAKVKLFITHCGNNGMHEAMYHGVPMIGFPNLADQHGNSFSMKSHGFGIRMDILSFTSDSLIKNIREILNNRTYVKTMKQMSGILHDQPMSGRDTVCHWIEHVIKYGSSHLRTGAFELSWLEYFMVDILLFLLGIPCLIFPCLYCACRYCWKLMFRKLKEKVY